MKSLILALFFAAAGLSGAPFFQEEFSTERSAKRYNAWRLKPELTKDAKGNRCLKLSLKERSANSILSVPFRPADLAGRWVEVSVEIRGEGIAASQQPWNGVKFMLTITTPETTLYPGCNVKPARLTGKHTHSGPGFRKMRQKSTWFSAFRTPSAHSTCGI